MKRFGKKIKPCERCGNPSNPGERYCKQCRKQVLAELADAGYLGPKPQGHIGSGRTTEQREVTRDTKFGLDR